MIRDFAGVGAVSRGREMVGGEGVGMPGRSAVLPALSLDGTSLSAGCLAGRSTTSAVAALVLSSAACPCTSSLKPNSPLLGGNGPACGGDSMEAEEEALDIRAFNAISEDLHRAR